MPSAVVKRDQSSATGWHITITTASGRVHSNMRAGQSAQEAAAALANEMIRHHVWKHQVLAPPEVMEHIERICPGRRIR